MQITKPLDRRGHWKISNNFSESAKIGHHLVAIHSNIQVVTSDYDWHCLLTHSYIAIHNYICNFDIQNLLKVIIISEGTVQKTW